MPEGIKRIFFIVNPVSGVNHARKSMLAEAVASVFDPQQFECVIRHSESAQHVKELSNEAARAGFDVIVAVGGDGTLNHVVKGLIGNDSVLAVVPAGSGNGLARHMNIPIDIEQSLRLIVQGKTQFIDTVSINDDLFVSIAGVGFDALVAKRFSQVTRRGFFSYFRIVTNEYTWYRPRKYRMEIDGKQVVRQALFVSFANTNQFGYNTIISPEARIDDGLVDVCIVKKVPLLYAPRVVGMLITRRVDSSGFVEIIRARKIRLTRNKNRVVNIDGEPVKLTKDLEISVNPLSIRMIIP